MCWCEFLALALIPSLPPLLANPLASLLQLLYPVMIFFYLLTQVSPQLLHSITLLPPRRNTHILIGPFPFGMDGANGCGPSTAFSDTSRRLSKSME